MPSVRRLSKQNAWLLTVMHTTRTLDTALSEIIDYKRWHARRSLGGYLTELKNNGIISNAERQHYEEQIVKKRNKYMHEAGAMPDQLEANKILSEMHACLSGVTALVR
jgi:hypothetical protein